MQLGIRSRLPQSIRNEITDVRRLGAQKYLYYKRLGRRARRRIPPRAEQPFHVGGEIPIVLDGTTVPEVRAHWVEHAQMIEEIEVFKRLAPTHSVFLDVGASHGIFSALFCSLTGKQAWAFEPSAERYACLVALIDHNPAMDITPLRLGLGATAGEQAVEVYSDRQYRGSANGSERMHVESLDSWVQQHGLQPDFAKIDVEGMELEVLRGGSDTFQRSIETIMLELHLPLLIGGESADDVQSLLAELGFTLHALDGMPIDDLARHASRFWEFAPGITNVVCSK